MVRDGCRFGYVVNKDSVGAKYLESWEPSDELISSFEHELSMTPFFVPNSYGRQYVGFVENGSRILHIAFFCDDLFPWHQELDRMNDGGFCLLHATYVVDAGEIVPQWYLGPRGPTWDGGSAR